MHRVAHFREPVSCHGAVLLLDKENIRQLQRSLVDGESYGVTGSMVFEVQLLLTVHLHWIPP